MELPETYIPIDRRLALARGEALPESASGAALFADISGFTPLTDALVRFLGPQRGAEELPRQLNRVYDAVIAQIERFGGSVVGFSGDAVTCWFDSDTGLRAAASGLAIQEAMEQFRTVPIPGGTTVELAIKVAVAAGSVRRFVVGSPDMQLLDVLAGATIDRLAIAEHYANRGDVVLDPQAASNIADYISVVKWHVDQADGQRFAVINRITADVPPTPWPMLEADTLSEGLIRPWLLPAILDRLRSGLGEFLTELRPSVALFVQFRGIDYDDDVLARDKLDGYIRWVQAVLQRFGGFLIQLTVGDKGSYLYAAFGAPIAHGDDATRAVAAALELRAPPSELTFITSVQIGISAGRMRTGAYGSSTARTYGVLGPEVNMAARLMQHAPANQVLVSLVARKDTGDAFIWEELPKLRVKGKAEPTTVFRLIGTRALRGVHLQEPQYALPMVGRTTELDMLEQKLQLAFNHHGQIIAITAEAGMGKSRLVAETIRRAHHQGLAIYGGECQSYGTNNSYLVWEGIWRVFFGLDQALSIDEQIQTLETQLNVIDPSLLPRLPLLGMALNLPIPDNDLTRSLDAKLRKASLEALLVDCVRVRSLSAPLLLVLEDCHWLDPLSHDLLEAVGRAIVDVPVMIVVAYRPPEVERLQAPRVTRLDHCTVVSLTSFTSEEAARLVGFKWAQRTGSTTVPPAALVDRITKRAEGNPFYIEELLNYLYDRGVDPHDQLALTQLELPTSLHSLILSRIDQLTESQKLTIKVASIIGRLFRLSWLWGVHPGLGQREQVLTDLDSLNRLDLTPLDQPEPEYTYLFKHIITREVAYESLSFATRELLHDHLGLFIEQSYDDTLDQYIDLLAYHFDHSHNLLKRREYLLRAGEAAQKVYANEATIDYYERLLPLLSESEVRQRIHARLGEVLAITAQYDSALDHLRKALNLAAEMVDYEAEARACRWISYVHEFRSEFAVALQWIQHGLDALGDEQTATTAELLAIAALISTRQGNYSLAAEQCERSIVIAVQLNAVDALAFAHNARATVFQSYGNYTAAIDYFLKAAELYERAENIPGQAMAYYGISNNYFNLARWSEAYDYALRAREIFIRTGDQLHRAFTDNALGELARHQGRLDDARMFYEEALIAFEHLGGSPYVIGIIHLNLGATFTRQGEVDMSRRHLAISQACFADTQSRDVLPDLYMRLAEAALVAGELGEAEANGQQALSEALALEMRGEEGMIRRVLGEIATARGDTQQSETHLAKSISIFNEIGQEYEAAQSHLALAKIYFKNERFEESLAHLYQCTPVFQRLEVMRDLETAWDLREKLEQNV